MAVHRKEVGGRREFVWLERSTQKTPSARFYVQDIIGHGG